MDDARLLLQSFAQFYPQEGNDYMRAFIRTRNEAPQVYGLVLARSLISGHVHPIAVGEQFRYRCQLLLSGLHNRLVHGICTNLNGVATCVVIKYPLHNFENDDGSVWVGGQGGNIAEADQVGERILANQELMNEGNLGMANAMWTESSVRLVVYQQIQPGNNNVGNNPHNMGYEYRGIYNVVDELEFETDLGFSGVEFVLQPAQDDVLLAGHGGNDNGVLLLDA